MKRIQTACLSQTLHFMLKEEGIGHAAAVKAVREEVAQYKQQLERGRVRHRILSETEQPDGSVLLAVVKQYNGYPVGDYLD